MSASVAAKSLAFDQETAIASGAGTATGKRELRVLQVFSVLSVGGAETWLMALLKYFNDGADRLQVKVKCDILLTGGEPSVFDEEAKSLGARLFYVPFSRQHPVRFMKEFRRILKAGHYHVIHDHQDYIAGLHFAMGIGRLPHKRLAHVHSALLGRSRYANDRVRRIALSTGKRLLKRFATHVLGTSQTTIDEYGFECSAFPGAAVVNCGFDASRFVGDYAKEHEAICREFGWPRSARIILFVGRLDGEVMVDDRVVSQKNIEFALEIAKQCFARDPTVRMLVVGSGEERRKVLQTKVERGGFTERVHFLAGTADVPQLMIGSEVLLFTSPAEGLGMVVVEAQAAGLPVLASDTTPRECVVVSELVDFLPLTDPRDWVDHTLNLLSKARPKPSESNAAVSKSAFSIENSAKKLAAIYSE
jgi:glycosyltransferase involved in cell wall biosynthesis